MLTDTERQVLVPLLQQPHVMVSPTPLILEALRERGYVRFERGFAAGRATGELMACLTETGRAALAGGKGE